MSFPSIDMPATECLVPREDLAWYYEQYYGENNDTKQPRVSPIFADDLSGLPSALIIAAEYDTLRDEAKAYADRLRSSGSEATYVCYDGNGYRSPSPRSQIRAHGRSSPSLRIMVQDGALAAPE